MAEQNNLSISNKEMENVMIDREFATKWCNDLKCAWERCDFQKICDIFGDTSEYYEDPFATPGRSADDILSFWEEIKYQRVSKLKLKPIAIDENRLIVRWFLDYTDVRDDSSVIMDGIYQVDFNEFKRCIRFTQWWVIKE